MNTLRTLGGFAGGFLLSPPPRSVFATLVWLGARSHPAITVLFAFAVLVAWRRDHG